MEYVKGPTLTQLLVNENPLAVDRVVDIMMQSLAGIEEAHLAGVVHADLKADNIILDQRRAGVDMVKIVDFGIARLVTGVATDPEDRSISGTPEYMAPEVISGAPPSFASDVYAVGIILYELLAYKTPFFAGSTTEILANHLKAMIPSLAIRARAGAEGARRDRRARRSRSIRRIASRRPPEMREALAGCAADAHARTGDRHVPVVRHVSARRASSSAPSAARRARARQQDVRDPGAAGTVDVLPLPFTGRGDELADVCSQHMRARRAGDRPQRRSARHGLRGCGPQRAAPPRVRADRRADGARRSIRSVRIRAGSRRRSTRSARCSPRCCSCRRCRARSSCATR